MRYLFILILAGSFFLMQGCNIGTAYHNLSGDYAYVDGGHDVRYIMYMGEGKGLIYPNVTSYAYNKDFILVRQVPTYAAYKTVLSGVIRSETPDTDSTTQDMAQSERKADSLIKYSTYHKKIFSQQVNYWIIIVGDKKICGPYSKAEFLQKRTEFGVPEGLHLNE